MPIGTKAPDFDLPGIDGADLSLSAAHAGNAATVVIFACCHCPYAVSYVERLIKMESLYGHKGVGFVMINPDDEEKHPEDALESMKTWAAEKGCKFPFLRDKAGNVAKAYGAKVLPEVFLLDAGGTIRYSGRIDDCWQSARRVKRHDLREAIEDILHDRDVAVKTTPAIGCTIKFP